MNIKSFCAVALAAVGAVVSLSGCGGGGDESREDSYVSLKKFAAGAVTIYTVNTRSLEIIPTGKISNQHSSVIEIPPSIAEGESTQYQVDGSVLCSGSIGVRGVQSYQAELLYQVSGEDVGCIRPIILDGGSLDDTPMLNALGYATWKSEEDDYFNGLYNRLIVNKWGEVGIRLLLNFKTGRMTIYTSGAGFYVTYSNSTTGVYTTGIYPGELLQAEVSYPYIVEKR